MVQAADHPGAFPMRDDVLEGLRSARHARSLDASFSIGQME